MFKVTETASGSTFANKVIDKGMFKEKRSAKEKVEREIKIHRELNHKNVVKFFNYFEDKSFVHLLLELCPQKTLLHVSKYRKKVEEEEARYYANQITQGLNFLHSKGILHRDLKLGNMFLSDQMVVKIGDFGLASAFEGNSLDPLHNASKHNFHFTLATSPDPLYPRQQSWFNVRHSKLHRTRSFEERRSQSRL